MSAHLNSDPHQREISDWLLAWLRVGFRSAVGILMSIQSRDMQRFEKARHVPVGLGRMAVVCFSL